MELSLPYDLIKDLGGDSFRRENFRNLATHFGLRGYQFSDLTFRNNNNEVIFPKQKLEFIVPDVGNRRISIDNAPQEMLILINGKLFWQLYADNMPFKNGEIDIRDIKNLT